MTAPHLKVLLTLTGAAGQVWYEYILFPDIPFIFCQTFLHGSSTAGASGQTDQAVLCSGIEENRTETEDIYCDEDTLECLPLGNRVLELETFTLYDKTDGQESLLERNTVPLYSRGTRECDGNLFRITDYSCNDSLLLVKHAPTPSSALHRIHRDLLIYKNQYAALRGSGVDYQAQPDCRIPCYASAVGAAGTDALMTEFFRYYTAFCRSDPSRHLFLMSNTWGDRSQDSAVCEAFILKELDTAKELGIQILQIDDGWQKGVTANSRSQQGGVWEGYYSQDPDFWSVNPLRFPNGLAPVLQKARSLGIQIGLWFSPDSSREFQNVDRDIDTLWQLHQQYGICYFKLDGIKIRSKLCEVRFIHLLKTLTEKSQGRIRFNLDVTAEDRFGYLYEIPYGTLFVENRYTDFGNYFPHSTFRNLWSLSAVIPPRKLQMEFLNCRRNAHIYSGLPFAPDTYSMDYVFATVLPANPLAWMELQHLSQRDRDCLAPLTSLYLQYQQQLFASQVIPIGEKPNGMHFSGYCCRCENGKVFHVLLFRETSPETEHFFSLPFSAGEVLPKILYKMDGCQATPQRNGLIFSSSRPRSFLWLRYDLS